MSTIERQFVSSLIPTPKEFILREKNYEFKKAKLLHCAILPKGLKTGLYLLHLFIRDGGETHHVTKEMQLSEDFEDVVLTGPITREKLVVTASDIYHSLRENYDFAAAFSTFHQSQAEGNPRPKIAFTVNKSTVRGGGTINVFSYVNWLSELGVDVAVYSDDRPPDWIDVRGRFYYIEDAHARYEAITEPVIIVYSILELQDLLCSCSTENKLIYHLCRGVEEYHYCGPTYASLFASKPIFEFLFSLPVGRIAVSRHVRDYFQRNYNQETYNIFNGVDLDFFTPRPEKTFGKDINILSSGNPSHPLKAKADIINALDLLAKAHTDLNFCLTIAGGEKKLDCFAGLSDIDDFTCESRYCFGTGESSFTCEVRCGLSQDQMRQAYHSSDIYINSSWYEGFGLPTLEAMACGVPVVQADNQGLTGIVIDRKNCLLVPPNNPRKMAQAIEMLIKNDVLRNDIIGNGFETTRKFSKRNQYEMFVTEFEKILHCKFDQTLVDAREREPDFDNFQSKSEKSDRPLFSVLVPTYNQAKYLPEALDSLIKQTCDSWEAIVVNDGSTDETAEVMKRYAEKDKRIRTFHEDNGGVASALNEGLRNANGEWICWLSSDDLFEPDKLTIHLQAIEENPHIRFFHTHYSVLHQETGRTTPAGLNLNTFIPPAELQVLKFFEINYFNGISIAVRREVFEQVGRFNEEYRAGQDFDMWLRISALYPSHFINKRTCITRVHPAQGASVPPGTVLYDSPGIYDSARACLEFLNNNEFPALFPALDLSITEHAVLAIKSTLKVVVNPLSFVNRCGYAPALMDRMYEWFTNSTSAELRSLLRPQLVQTFNHIQKTNLPEEIDAAFQSSRRFLEKPLLYRRYDPISEMTQHADRLEKRGAFRRAFLVNQYLADISKSTNQHISVDNQPLFSVLVPTYNQARYLPEALNSILSQTYGNWEAIVVNDGSTDETADVMKHYTEKDSRIRTVHKENGGVASALNAGIKNAGGEWICWLSSDDFFEPDKLRIHLRYIKENPHIRFFHTNYLIFDEKIGAKCALKLDPRELVSPVELQVLKFFERNCANGISVAIHRQVFDHVGRFNEKYRYGQDFDMWLRINARYRALFIDHKTCVTRWHTDQGTSSFPEGGFYDSSRACIEFLNSHKFSECFPMIELTTLNGAAKAVRETLAVVLNLNAMMYKCYFNTVLLERLGEWLSQYCPKNLKQLLMPHLEGVISKVMDSQLPEEMKTALLDFSENMADNFHFSTHDFSEEAAQYARKLLSAGEPKRAESIERYLSLIKSSALGMVDTGSESASWRESIIVSGRRTSPQQNEPRYEHGLRESSFRQTEPLVSIIMPAYNAADYIAQAIESVLIQNYRNFELIVVDDGSADDTKDIVAGFKEDKIKYFYKENAGAASARNLALKKSKGDFLISLDADDMMTPDFIARHLEEFEKHPEADLIYCDDSLIDENGKPIRVIKRPEYPDRKSLISDLFHCGFPVVPFRTCIRKSVIDRIGLYDEDLLVAEDYDMMRRFVKGGLNMHHLKDALYLRRMTSNSLSRNFNAQNAKCHFEVVRRFADTFTCDELFPNIAWDKIPPQMRQLHAKCQAATIFLTIGQSYVKSNSLIYAKTAFGQACSQLNDCLRIDPANQQVRQLLQKCELVRARYENTIQQVAC